MNRSLVTLLVLLPVLAFVPPGPDMVSTHTFCGIGADGAYSVGPAYTKVLPPRYLNIMPIGRVQSGQPFDLLVEAHLPYFAPASEVKIKLSAGLAVERGALTLTADLNPEFWLQDTLAARPMSIGIHEIGIQLLAIPEEGGIEKETVLSQTLYVVAWPDTVAFFYTRETLEEALRDSLRSPSNIAVPLEPPQPKSEGQPARPESDPGPTEKNPAEEGKNDESELHPTEGEMSINGAVEAAPELTEAELLEQQIVEAKERGEEPNPAWYQRLNELNPKGSGIESLDQGSDACPGTTISSLPYSDTGTTSGRVNNFTACGSSAPDVIYKYTAASSGSHRVSLCGSSYDTKLEVRTGGSCPGSTQLVCNDDVCGVQSCATVTFTAGQTYYIIVDGYGSYSGNYYLSVSRGQPDLNYTTPSGWAGPIVVSNTTGTHTQSTIYANQSAYIDWAAKNIGEGLTGCGSFNARIKVDGTVVYTWTIPPPFPQGSVVTLSDFSYTFTTTGNHVVRLEIDYNGQIAESNENNNNVEYTVNVQTPPRPDLTYTTPSGWAGPIVVSSTTGTHSQSTIYANQPAYIDWAGINSGQAAATVRFYTRIKVDGNQVDSRYTDPPVNPNAVFSASDIQYTFTTTGNHVVRVEFDYTGQVTESNENNNYREYTVNVQSVGNITVTGTFVFYDENAAQNRACRWDTVRLWDEDGATDQLLATGVTDANGSFSLGPVSNADPQGGTQDIFVVIYANSARARAFNSSNQIWACSTATVNNVSSGSYAYGQVGAPTAQRGMWNILYQVQEGWGWVDARPGGTPGQCTAHWWSAYSGSTYASGTEIWINGVNGSLGGTGPDHWDNAVILHEYGHFIAFWQGIDNSPGGGHWWCNDSGNELAWSEGWASYLSSAARNSTTYVDDGLPHSQGQMRYTINLETGTADIFHYGTNQTTSCSGNALGLDCEGSVAGILWDIHDSANDDQNSDGIGDALSNGPDNIWDVIDIYTTGGHGVYIAGQFWDGWFVRNHGNTQAMWAIYQEHGQNQDSQAPTGSILVNNGAASTTTLIVTLNLSASDAMSGMGPLARMRFSNNNSTWSAPEAYATTRNNWNLSQYGGNSNPGTKTTYVRYKDAAGNESSSFSDNIVYNPGLAARKGHGTLDDELSDMFTGSNAPVITENALHQSTPNPFNPVTTIRYDVKETGLVSVKIFDLLGREVATLVHAIVPAGSYSIDWNAGDLPSGVYLCRMEAQDFMQTRKVVLLK